MKNLLLFPAAKKQHHKKIQILGVKLLDGPSTGSLGHVTFSLLWNVLCIFYIYHFHFTFFFTFTNSPNCSFPGYSQSVGWFEAFATLPGVLVARWIQLVPLCLHLFVWSLLESSQCPSVTAVTSAGLGYELHFIKCHAEVLRHWCTAY